LVVSTQALVEIGEEQIFGRCPKLCIFGILTRQGCPS
jgi:hypothetical protein